MRRLVDAIHPQAGSCIYQSEAQSKSHSAIHRVISVHIKGLHNYTNKTYPDNLYGVLL